MGIGFASLGILFVLYYLILIIYSKRFRVTFGWFWLVFGIVFTTLGICMNEIPIWVEYVIQGIFAVGLIVFLFVQILLLSSMLVLSPERLDACVVLGAQIRGVKVTETLKRRLDKALHFLQEHPDTYCVVSGGQGKGEMISEAKAMAEYLMACGIDEKRIRLEEKSKNTYQNLDCSRTFINDMQNERIGIVTNNFHMYRAMKLARLVGYKKVYAMPASCNPVFFVNYMMREFFAVFVMLYRILRKRT